nr:MAG TPA: hypothetical protein [Caudoviricetes sp.]
MLIGKMLVRWCLPIPSRLASKTHLVMRRPSTDVSLPRLIDVNGQICYRKGLLPFASAAYAVIRNSI